MREWGRVVATTFHPEARHADGHEDTKFEAMEANNGAPQPRFLYRRLGVEQATGGAYDAHVIKGVPGSKPPIAKHKHTELDFLFVYVLKDWMRAPTLMATASTSARGRLAAEQDRGRAGLLRPEHLDGDTAGVLVGPVERRQHGHRDQAPVTLAEVGVLPHVAEQHVVAELPQLGNELVHRRLLHPARPPGSV
jgi:hypothetical protein